MREKFEQPGNVRETNRLRKRLIRLAAGLPVMVVSTCALAIFIFGAHTEPVTSKVPPKISLSSDANSQASAPQRGPVQVVRFTLYDVGIYPRESHVSHGSIAIIIEDLSGGSFGVVIERQRPGESPVRVGSVQRSQHWRARNDLQLGPGQYEIYVPEHPNNRAVLIVEP